jgi:type IV secretion system protein VirD4
MGGKGGLPRGGSFWSSFNALAALHHRASESDYAARAREEAALTRWRMAHAKPSGALGDGRLADDTDIDRAGLRDPRGLFFGTHNNRMLFWSSDESLLTYLRPGGGKGVAHIQPNLAHSYDRSFVVTDVKNGELAWSAAEHRSERLGIPNIFINPYGLHGYPTTRINPLERLIDLAVKEQAFDGEAEAIAHILLPEPPKAGDNDWVRKGAIQLAALRMEFAAAFDPDHCTLGDVWCFATGGPEHFDYSFSLMATCGNESIERRAQSFDGMRRQAPKQWEAIRYDLSEALSCFDPGKALGRATAAHEFDFTRLKLRPHTVFIMLPVNRLDVAAPFASLIVNSLIETLAAAHGPVQTTFILDEFANMPKVSGIRRSLRLHRSLGLQYWFFAQSRHAMTGKWAKEEVKEIEDLVGCTLLRSVWETDVIRDIELWSGNRTIHSRGVSHNGGTVEAGASNLGETKRPVLQSEDIIGLGPDRQIVRIASMPRLLIADAVPYFFVKPWSQQLRDVRELHRGIEP